MSQVVFGKMRLQNYGPFLDVEFDLGGVGATVIWGRNGSGKSHLLDAFRYALTGRHEGTADSIVNRRTKKNLVVDLPFKVGDQDYRILRSRKSKEWPDKFYFWKGDEAGAALQKHVEEVVGLSADLVPQVLAVQRVLPFAQSTPMKQQALLDELLELTFWRGFYNLAKDSLTSLTRDLNSAYANRENKDANLAALKLNIQSLLTSSQNHRASKESRMSPIKHQINVVEQEIRACVHEITKAVDGTAVEAALRSVSEALANKQAERDKALETKPTADQLRQAKQAELDILQKVAEICGRKQSLESRIQTKRVEYAGFQGLEGLVGTKCPTCGVLISSENAQTHRDDILGAIEVEAKGLKEEVAQCDKELQDLSPSRDAAGMEYIRLTNEEQAFTRLVEEVNRLQAQYNLKKVEKDNLFQNRGIYMVKKQEAEKRLEFLKSSLEAVENEANPFIPLLQEKQGELNHLKSELEEAQKKVDELEALKARRIILRKAGQEIPGFLLDRWVPKLNETSADALDNLGEGFLRAFFSPTKQNQDGSVRKQFSLIVENSKGAGEFERNSSGEQTCVNLSIMFGFNKMLRLRHYRKFGLLWLDEVDRFLDAEKSAILASYLKKVSQDVRIFITTHNEHLANRFEDRYEVVSVMNHVSEVRRVP